MDLPRLRHLMNSYFHQDYDLEGVDDAAILRSFAQTSHAEDVKATVVELDRFLDEPIEGLLDIFVAATGRSNMVIADDDRGAVAWLREARTILAARIG